MIRSSRSGFSMLEVIMATSILLGSVIVLSELAGIGRRHATTADDLSRVQLLCQSKLDSILAGVLPMEPVQKVPFEDDPEWTFTIETKTLDKPGLIAILVTVAPADADDLTDEHKGPRFTLIRWMRDTDSLQTGSSQSPTQANSASASSFGNEATP